MRDTGEKRERRQNSIREKDIERGKRKRRVSFASRSIWPKNVGRSRDCPVKQPNSPHVDFTKVERERENARRNERKNKRPKEEERGTEGQRYELTRGPYQR